MESLLRWLAERIDLDVEPGTELRVELSSFPEGGAGFLVLLALLAVVAIVVVAYKRDAHRVPRGRRIVLATLRTLAVLAAFMLLLEPNLVAVKRDVRAGATVVLVDVSQSMAQKDPYRRVPDLAAAWRKAGVGDPEGTERINLVKHLLSDEDHALLRELAKHNDVHVYGFHAGLDPVTSLEYVGSTGAAPNPDAPVATGPDTSTLAATGRFSNLGFAVRSALERHRDASLAGLVLLSDGRRNLGAQGPEIARLLEQRKVGRTLVLPIGDPSSTQTLRITRIDAPEKVFQKDPFTVRANIESTGYDDITVSVRLARERDGSGKEIVQSQQVRLGDTAREVLAEFRELRSAEPGIFTYSVEIDPPEFEAPSPERHIQRTQIEVLGEQTRVMLVAGGPSHEYRFLRTQLIRDQTVDLSCWLLSADPDFPQDGNTVLERLPDDREKLDAFDVFLFLDPDSSKLSPEFCELVAKQVEENGAGLWWVCGEIYTLDALRPDANMRALSEILPIVPDVESADHRFGLGRARTEALRYELTPAGARHKVARLVDRQDVSEQLWNVLPGFYVGFPVDRAKAGAVVLAEFVNPREPQRGRIPLLATQFYGAGRTMWLGTDDIYRWRAVHEQAYNRFWVKGIRHLFEGRLSAGNNRLSIDLDELKVELGAPQRIVVTARDEAFEPLVRNSFDVVLEAEGSATAENLVLTPIEGAPGQYEARFWPATTGFYRVRPAQQLGRDVQVTFQVVPAQIEREGPADLSVLGAIAAVPGGLLCSNPEQLTAAARQIESMSVIDTFSSSHAVWDSWVTVAIILSLLAAEWVLRKRSNLL